jgi:CDGSH-type Zn-finger protein
MNKGQIAGHEPIAAVVEKDDTVFWCVCGKSANQPYCDGSHAGTDFRPLRWTAEESGERWFCVCKQTGTPPFCDGTHKTL